MLTIIYGYIIKYFINTIIEKRLIFSFTYLAHEVYEYL